MWVWFVFVVINIVSENVRSVSHQHDLNIDRLNDFWHRTAVMALLRAKGQAIQKRLPATERAVYNECARDARTPPGLAQCVVGLLNARDRGRTEFVINSSDGDLFSEMKNLFTDLFPIKDKLKNSNLNFKSNLNKNNNENKEVKKEVLVEINNNEHENNDDLHYLNNYQHRTNNIDNNFISRRINFKPRRTNKLPNIYKRSKRTLPTSLANLQRLRNYVTMLDKTNNYIKTVNNNNQQFIKSSGSNIGFEVKEKEKINVLDDIMVMINNITSNSNRISILSPKLFPIFSSKKRRPHIMSPNLFSFQENDGVFSLPDIFQVLSIGREETNAWLETLLQLSGADKAIQQALSKLQPEIKEYEQNVHPKIVELQRWERMWGKMHDDFDVIQTDRLKENGYAFLKPNQMEKVYKSSLAPQIDNSAYMTAHLTEAQKEYRLENDIRKLAKYGQNLLMRKKRSDIVSGSTNLLDKKSKEEIIGNEDFERLFKPVNTSLEVVEDKEEGFKVEQEEPVNHIHCNVTDCYHNTNLTIHKDHKHLNHSHEEHKQHSSKEHDQNEHDHKEHHSHEEELPKFETLAPFAFGATINKGVVLEGLTLSPYAFWSEIVQPEALNFQILSPRAFIPSILSPSALIARILSPAAFRAEILSPRALHAWILTPEALIAEVLSPKALETRILSPEALVIQILSPNTLAPKILSPEAVGVLVLSPSVLSPHILSSEKMMVEVLSPSILSGSEEESEEKSGEKSHKHGGEHEHNKGHDHENEHIHGETHGNHGQDHGDLHNVNEHTNHNNHNNVHYNNNLQDGTSHGFGSGEGYVHVDQIQQTHQDDEDNQQNGNIENGNQEEESDNNNDTGAKEEKDDDNIPNDDNNENSSNFVQNQQNSEEFERASENIKGMDSEDNQKEVKPAFTRLDRLKSQGFVKQKNYIEK